jgi:hypothetical protein
MNTKSGNKIPKTLIVLDTENLIISCNKELKRSPMLYELDLWLHEKYNVVDKHAFVKLNRMNGTSKKLNNLGWTLNHINCLINENRNEPPQKNALDIELALSTYQYAINSQIDIIVLISGDGDFLPLIKRLKQLGIQIDILSLKSCTSSRLMKFSDNFFDYESLNEKMTIGDFEIKIEGVNGGYKNDLLI